MLKYLMRAKLQIFNRDEFFLVVFLTNHYEKGSLL